MPIVALCSRSRSHDVSIDVSAGVNICVLSPRNFGDAVVQARLAVGLERGIGESSSVVVFTRPQFVQQFRFLGFGGRIYEAEFPMGARKAFSIAAAARLATQLIQLRRCRFTLVVNELGDIRENLIARLIGPHSTVAPVWAAKHPMRRMLWCPDAIAPSLPVPVAAATVNVYEVQGTLASRLSKLLLVPVEPQTRPALGNRPSSRAGIGLHPFATQECRMWPALQWRALAQRLAELGERVSLYGLPEEISAFRRQAGLDSRASASIAFVSDSLPGLAARIARLRLLICLDSFAMHLAHAVQTPALVINGGNSSAMWLPIGTSFLENGGRCPAHPCYNNPTCRAAGMEAFACIRGIPVEAVFQAALARLSTTSMAETG
jgi:heptosyltransferase-3